jgi:hypothetical protein
MTADRIPTNPAIVRTVNADPHDQRSTPEKTAAIVPPAAA